MVTSRIKSGEGFPRPQTIGTEIRFIVPHNANTNLLMASNEAGNIGNHNPKSQTRKPLISKITPIVSL